MSDLFSIQSPAAEKHEFLAVFMHGWGSDERDLASLSAHLPAGLPWASLRAPLRHPSMGYAWYPLEDGFLPTEEIARATESIWSWVDANVAHEVRLIPLGFSQGAMMASQLLRTRPERIGATVVLSGYVSRAPQPADDVLSQLRPSVFWGRGDQDQVIPADKVDAAALWFANHTSLESHVYPAMGHNVCEDELVDIRHFLDRTLS